MNYLSKYIPKEYLELKINYCRQQLEKLPVVTLQKSSDITRVITDNHRYSLTSKNGKYYLDLMKTRDDLEFRLRLYQTIWDCHFRGKPTGGCIPYKANRVIYVDTNKPVIMNREYFDSLENDANDTYLKTDNYRFNGIKYRSAAERDIAIFYTEMGIPFKYEPRVSLKGLVKPIYPDFVPYFEELDTCKFHEHFGIKESADYMTTTKIKYGNYAAAGLIPDLDILFTYDTEDMPFDIRYLSAKLNSAVYGTAIIHKQ